MQRKGIIKRTFLFAMILVTVLAAVHPAFLPAGEAEDTLRLEQAARKATPAEFRNILAGIKNLSKRTLGAALLAACDGDNYNAIVPMLLDAGASPTFGEDRNNGALSKAVSRRIEAQNAGSLASVRLLLQRGATADSANEMGFTPLMQAASANDLKLAELLISFHANPGFQNRDGRTALDMAGNGPMRALLEKAAQQKPNLWDDPSVAAVKLLPLSGGGQKKSIAPSIVPGVSERNRQIMQQVLFANDIDLLRDIMSDRQGANAGFHPDMDLDGGYRPLMLVQSAEAAKILLKHGANPSLSDAKGKTALHYAVMSQRSAEIVPVLLAAGADANARDSAGDTPLSLVIIVFIEFRENAAGEQLLRQLVKAGADINSRDKWGDTLLHVAANNDYSALATAALALGADANVVNHSGDTPLAIARRLNSRSVSRLLEKR